MTLADSQRANETYTLITSYDIYDRDIHQELIGKVPRSRALSWMKAQKGRLQSRKVRRHKYSFYEEGQFFNASATIAAASNSGSDVLVTLSSADHQNSGTSSYPVLNDLVVFTDETVGFVSAINTTTPSAHIVTIKRVNTSQDVQTAAVVGSSIVFYSNAQPEASTETSGRVPQFTKVDNYIQTFRVKYEVTDHAAQNEIEFTYKGQRFVYNKGMDDTADRFEMAEELGLLITPSSESLTDASSNSIQLAQGLLQQIKAEGIEGEYFGKPDISTIDDDVVDIDNNYGDKEYIVGYGRDAGLGLKNFLIEFSANGGRGVSFNAFENKSQALSFNFESVAVNGTTMHFNNWMVLSHRDSLGADGMPYKDMMIYIPTGKTIDPQMNQSVPYCLIAYSTPNHAPHENHGDHAVYETGAGAKRGATDDEEVRKIHMISYKSMEVRCRNKFKVNRKGD